MVRDSVNKPGSADTIVKWSSFVGSVIIFLSILKAYVFYATFGIRITNYISFSEAILLFLNEIAVLALFLLLILAVGFFFYYPAHLFSKKLRPGDLIIPQKDAPIIHKIFALAIYLYPVCYLLYAVILNTYRYGHAVLAIFFLISFSVVAISLFLLLKNLWQKSRDNTQKYIRSATVYILFSCVVFFYVWSLDRQLFLFHRNRINKDVIVYTENQPARLTNKNIQYLGATRDFLFCYLIKEKRAVVIPVENYTRVEFGRYGELPGFSVFDLLYH